MQISGSAQKNCGNCSIGDAPPTSDCCCRVPACSSSASSSPSRSAVYLPIHHLNSMQQQFQSETSARRMDSQSAEALSAIGVDWGSFSGVSHWRLFLTVVLSLLVSFVIANAIAFYFQVRREKRIREKTTALAKFGPEHRDGEQRATLKPVPVTILTGFLGTGKTTLLNRILQTPELPYKVMVLENEIGTISIDHALLQPGKTNDELAKDGIYVLQNGCMCCTARGAKGSKSELERILDYLLRIVNEEGFDYLLVETTGLADPGPIIETFLQLRASRFRLDSIVTMVDSHAIQRFYSPTTETFDLPVELQRQLLYADVVALNKTDLVDDASLLRAKKVVTSYNEGTTVLECVNAELDLGKIVGIDTFDAVKFRANGAKHTHSDTGEHTKGIQTMHLQVDAAVDVAKLTDWLDKVTAEYARSHILRIKGILALSNSPRRCVLQGVLDTYTIAPSAAWGPTETRTSQVVVIGKSLNRARLEDGFLQCLADASVANAHVQTSPRTLQDKKDR